MNRQQKELVVKALHDSFQKSNASFFVGVKGLTVSQSQALRCELRQKGGRLMVAKVRLMKRAVSDMAYRQSLEPFLKEQIGVVFVLEESPAVAKTLYDFAKENNALSLIAGCLDSQVLTKQDVERVALLPSKDILRAQLCGVMKAPIVGLVSVLQANILRLVLVLKEIEKKTTVI